jgi:hypothetical protein
LCVGNNNNGNKKQTRERGRERENKERERLGEREGRMKNKLFRHIILTCIVF